MPYPDIDTQAIKDTTSKVLDSASAAIKDPSNWATFGVFMKEAAMAGGAFFKFFGIADTLNELRKLWTGKKDSQNMAQEKHSFLAKLGLSALYGGHIAATAIAAAVILGASVVAAPIATLIVSATALVKNVGEFVKEFRHTNRVKKELKNAQQMFKEAKLDFNRSLVAQKAHADLLNDDNKIKELQQQRTELQNGNLAPQIKQAQLASLDKKIVTSQQLLKNKKEYVNVFAPKPVELEADKKQLFDRALAVVDKENNLKLATLQRNKKAKNIGFSLGVLAFAVCLCVPALWPVAGAMTIAAAGVGIAAAISSLYDGYKKRQIKKENTAQREEQAKKLLSEDITQPTVKTKNITTREQKLITTLSNLTAQKSPEQGNSAVTKIEQASITPIVHQQKEDAKNQFKITKAVGEPKSMQGMGDKPIIRVKSLKG